MNYEDFCIKVKEAASELFGESAATEITSVTKNNGLVLKGLTVRHEDSRISPTIYLENFYEMYESGTPFGDIMNMLYRYESKSRRTDIHAEEYTDFESIKDRIIYKIVNFDMNRGLLEHVPHVEWNDLAIVFCCVLQGGENGYATVLVRNEHLKMWDIDQDELYDLARENTPRIMSDELKTIDEVLPNMFLPEAPDMYILSNEHRVFGATCMLYSEHLKEVADSHLSGIYILPSSIHEVILMPEECACEEEYMRAMIREINSTEVDLEDRLSDNLYYYDRDLDCISICSETGK
ncbi:MAG: hypothetical protein J5509_05860 [Lachnospiraceae bacterium]|nr:hypothetical protein [Lachnospiraceae bacterium]